MEPYKLRLIYTFTVLIVFFVLNQFIRVLVNRTLKKFSFSLQRRRIISKAFALVFYILSATIITGIWGVNKADLIVFTSTVLTILGVAFFAQWSILSNVTAGIILFFHHPLKLGDRIEILDKDIPVSGKIRDISYFFIHIKTDEGQDITIPNTVALYKTLSIMPED